MKQLRFSPINKSLNEGKDDSTQVLNEIKNKDEDAYFIANGLYKNAISSIYNNTNITYYKIGDDAFKPILEELKKAKSYSRSSFSFSFHVYLTVLYNHKIHHNYRQHQRILIILL